MVPIDKSTKFHYFYGKDDQQHGNYHWMKTWTNGGNWFSWKSNSSPVRQIGKQEEKRTFEWIHVAVIYELGEGDLPVAEVGRGENVAVNADRHVQRLTWN